jgi:hypothetical protein
LSYEWIWKVEIGEAAGGNGDKKSAIRYPQLKIEEKVTG